MDEQMTGVLREFLRRLKHIGAIKIEAGQSPPIYINLRTADNPQLGPLTPDDVDTVAALFWRHTRDAKIAFDGIAGVPLAGRPFAKALQEEGYHMGGAAFPLLILAKDEGPGGRRVGKIISTQSLPAGYKVLVVDDLITHADSKAEAIERLREGREGYRVEDVLVFLDRQQGGHNELSQMGVRLHSIVTVRAMLDFYRREGLIKRDEYEAVKEYLDQNA